MNLVEEIKELSEATWGARIENSKEATKRLKTLYEQVDAAHKELLLIQLWAKDQHGVGKEVNEVQSAMDSLADARAEIGRKKRGWV